MSQPKVVSIKPDRHRSAPIPPIVNTVRQYARRQLTGLLKSLLDSTDDALFEMADKSYNDLDHHLYFDSMREIRLHRAAIEKRFVEEVNEAFEDIFRHAVAPPRDDAEPPITEIEMLRNDDLEISVAISGIVSKITSQFSLPIMELTKRLDHLAKHTTVKERRNPLGPQLVSEAFASAISCLDVDIRIRIILLKLFERSVMQNMGPVYQATNQMLAQAGVLKDLRNVRARQPRATPPAGNHPAAGRPHQDPTQPGAPVAHGGAAGLHGGGFAGMHGGGSYGGAYAGGGFSPGYGGGGGAHGDYTSGHGGPDGSHGGHDGGYGGGDFGFIQTLLAGARGPTVRAPEPGTMVATTQLLNVLNSAQTESGQQYFDLAEVPQPVDLRQLVVSRASSQSGRPLNNLQRTDEDVVNFIGMLFDFILNDRNLAIPMKALIARLQIPIVKLAIMDKSFFNRTAHPARQLLNELSSAGIGWSSASELKRDAVYDQIESVVARVLNGFNENPEIFQELLEEIREFRSRDAARHGRMEQRVKETETGKARTAAAKQEVQQVINQKASGLRLPREIGRFLSDVWSRVLVYANLTEGEPSSLWQDLISTLDDLLWAMQPLDNLEQVAERDRARGNILKRLAKGMDVLQLPNSETNQWLDVIQAQFDDVSRNDRRFLDEGEAPSVEEYVEMEDIVLTEPGDAPPAYQGDAPAQEFVEKIDALSEGTWVEFLQDAPTPALRCKLTAIVEPGERYVFVNRRGMKVAESTRLALARDLQNEKLVILNDSQVFDRALQAVIGNLRKVQNSSVTA